MAEAHDEPKYAKILFESSDDYRSGLTCILSSVDKDKRLRGVYKMILDIRKPKDLDRAGYIEGILKGTSPGTAYKVLGRKWITKVLIQKYLREKGRTVEDDLKVTCILACLEFWGCPLWKEGATFHRLKSSAGRWKEDPQPMRELCEGEITLDGVTIEGVDERVSAALHQGTEWSVEEDGEATVFRLTDGSSEVWVEEERIVSIVVRRNNIEAGLDALTLCD